MPTALTWRRGRAISTRHWGSLVCDYLSPDEEQVLCIGELAALLRDIHQLPARHSRLHLAERILRYEKQLEHRGAGIDRAHGTVPQAGAAYAG